MKTLTISPEDNVTVLLEGSLQGHKIALVDIPKGSTIIKYGFPIGRATQDIAAGEHVHTHNLHTALEGNQEYTYRPSFSLTDPLQTEIFSGYSRADGGAGIRNEIWILPTVGCINNIADELARRAQVFVGGACEGIYAFGHPYGCSQLGDDHKNTQKLLCGLIHHPNAAGVLVLGLGCENNRIEELKKVLGPFDVERVSFLECQSSGNELDEGLALLQTLAQKAAQDRRTALPVSKLTVGLKCGGSDGFSGITANPLVGRFSDLLISKGSSAILTEVPEMFGAEQLLMNRCADVQTYERTVKMIRVFQQYYRENNQPIYENPSPGNKDGGITTLEEKSLGCTQKSGNAPVVDVLSYAQQLEKKGLNLLYAPGNDLVASTALAASGAQLVLFTTGRGTPFGCPVPTFKISTNTELSQKKPHWIDFDAGILLREPDIAKLAQALYDNVIALAEGRKLAKNEINGYREIAIFKTGVTL